MFLNLALPLITNQRIDFQHINSSNVMSVSSKSRKESTDSYASQQMQNGGVMPGMDQLQRFNQPADRPEVTTERIASADTDFSDDYAEISATVAEEDQPAGTYVDDADWNTSTEEGGMAPNRASEPDRTLGNS
jgi:hypothetical protein